MNNLFNLKSFFEFLKKNKSYTFIDVFGLSVSLMFVLLIATYTVQELSTDQFHEKKDRVYILGNEKYYGTAYRLGDRLSERYPEIEKICGMTNNFSSSIASIADVEFKADVLLADTTFFDLFSFELLKGDYPEKIHWER